MFSKQAIVDRLKSMKLFEVKLNSKIVFGIQPVTKEYQIQAEVDDLELFENAYKSNPNTDVDLDAIKKQMNATYTVQLIDFVS